MTFSHGNWFCKPKNNEESREIVERAVANGAELCESIDLYPSMGEWPWNVHTAWGVSDGKTYGDVYTNYVFESATEYTIEQVRQKFPLPGDRVDAA